ncbi:MAG: Recombination protein RecR [Candidatus Amesbacteria bacterium GW2011_GWA2_42_12]|uniref:Recombination protein RecR n=1 Tax=Candidatus Amesbacteria bacterium GW2011_GWA2_42_12 TaxID=1618356 RepID=A0A0G0Y8G2_9BACT|nr:MAG: Recombination protein RecR [Candidatus Amesbacteria bacterium GW2011_GWA2_42_12]
MTNLVEAFERLPGIGPKSAQRLTYYLLHVPQAELDKFALSLSDLKKNTKECSQCHNISETDPCDICDDENRDKSIICVVEQPLDVLALENAGRFKGVYHVLHGVIDPLHNIGPDEIKINELLTRLRQGSGEVKEIILALNPNMEGEATCLYINRQITNLKSQVPNIKVTRLAHGLPMGADIQYADDRTLTHALEDRKDYN